MRERAREGGGITLLPSSFQERNGARARTHAGIAAGGHRRTGGGGEGREREGVVFLRRGCYEPLLVMMHRLVNIVSGRKVARRWTIKLSPPRDRRSYRDFAPSLSQWGLGGGGGEGEGDDDVASRKMPLIYER